MYKTLATIKQRIFKSSLKNLKKPLNSSIQRLFLWGILCSFLALAACSTFRVNANSHSIVPSHLDQHFMNIKVLSSIVLKAKVQDGLPVVELSDIAWDEDEQKLYAISDEGYLYHLELDITKNQITKLNVLSATRLKDKYKQVLKGKHSDAEGLSLRNSNNKKKGDSKLIISFENKPRIAHYNTSGDYFRKIKTPKKLRKRKSFKHKNKALESVTLHPKYGVLTAPELPLKKQLKNTQTIYSSTGREWNFADSNVKNSSITALEVLANGDILILERAYNGLFSPIIIQLRQLKLSNCNKKQFCETQTLAKFDSSDGWLLDNFEGLSHFRGNQYLMISDNNKNPLQKTILVLFEIVNNQP